LGPALGVAALLLLASGCSVGPPVLCAEGLPDGGCTYHVEVHCQAVPFCSVGTQVLDAGSCVHNQAADIIGCS